MYQRIFVPVDNSDTSNQALAEAIKLANDRGATLLLAHVVEAPGHSIHNREEFDRSELEMPVRKIGEEIMKVAARQVRDAGLEPEEQILENQGESITRTLLDAAQTSKAELIVMGTHGRTGLMHLLMGSVAEGIMRAATLPVMLIRGDK